ncbi:IclR family transcriptional regulator domain-containing protein [Streptomyces sp. 8N114]|uniref:IclR family transcriptional regulator domain-containing protein n=1 Tax=Streptomyces sp. 8N114 TaxID=3457419 RepID=UPI003FD377A7
MPLHAGAASRVLPAFQDRSTWSEYLEQEPLEQFTKSTPVKAETLVPTSHSVWPRSAYRSWTTGGRCVPRCPSAGSG